MQAAFQHSSASNSVPLSEAVMKKIAVLIFVITVLCVASLAIPLGSSARAVIPSDIQQIISVDYRALRNSDTATALKQQVLPPNLKEFEGALKEVGIDA